MQPMLNPETQRSHRRQVLWQIFLPLLLGIALAVFLFLLVLRGGSGSIERSAQTATILLAVPVFVFTFVFLLSVIALSAGLSRLMKWLPPQSSRVQRAAAKLNGGVRQVSDAARQPFLVVESWGNALSRVWNRRR